ncbi:MAG: diguanylate cyclase [Pseudomonadota bacterium]|nr:diguanylate cyclase [Pseudomonadota bacterium]
MSAFSPPPDESDLVRMLMVLASTLRQTPDGEALHVQIELSNETRLSIRKSIDHAFAAFAYAMLRRYSRSAGNDSATRLRAALIQQRIIPFLERDPVPSAGADSMREGFEQQVASVLWSAHHLAAGDRRQMRQHMSERDTTVHRDVMRRSRIDEAYVALRRNLDDGTAEATDLIAHTRTARFALEKADDVSEFTALREILLDCLDEIVHDVDRLAGRLHSATDSAREIRSLHDGLRETAAPGCDPAMTDALTGIPNRTAFLHRLRAETGRAQRYGMPLALAMLDPDRIDDISSLAGSSAAEEVVRCYASEILSSFRSYDMVARFGENGEFAVLLPNTGREQAVSALSKARRQVPRAHFQHQGKQLSAPTFSSGLAWYLPGEQPENLLQRATQALRRAKDTGTNRTEAALPEAVRP